LAGKLKIPKRDAERARTVLKYAQKTEPKYGKPNSFGAYAMFLIGLAAAGLAVYYAFNHKEQLAKLWHEATHRDSVSVSVHPDQ
jgi:phosphotransferase system  glucose/maltose/N-acetylglucosamine-specific IIC component